MKLKPKKQLVENNTKTYSLKKDKKMIGIIFLLLIVVIQIFAFLQVPVLTTIHSYTIGMLFGVYNPFFYAYVAYLSLIIIFGDKVSLPSWVKLKKLSYWFVAIAIMFIGSSSGYIQNATTNGWTNIGLKPWAALPKWFDLFTAGNAWYPVNINGGLVGWILFSLTATVSSGVGSLIFAIIFVVLSVSLLVTGTWVGFYKSLLKSKRLSIEEKEIKNDQKFNLDKFDIKQDEVKQEKIKVVKQPIKIENEELPFEDPFA